MNNYVVVGFVLNAVLFLAGCNSNTVSEKPDRDTVHEFRRLLDGQKYYEAYLIFPKVSADLQNTAENAARLEYQLLVTSTAGRGQKDWIRIFNSPDVSLNLKIDLAREIDEESHLSSDALSQTSFAVIRCNTKQEIPLKDICHILAVYEEPSCELTNEEGSNRNSWPAVAVVVENGWGSSGALSPATLFMIAREDRLKLSATDLANGTRLAVPCSSNGIGGMWITGRDGSSFFVMEWDTGGTAGKRVWVISHTVVFSDPVQEHQFVTIMEEESRLPVYLADIDNDGLPEILIASKITNRSGSTDTPKKYRIVSVAGGSAKVLKEIDQNEIQGITNLVRLR